VPQCEVCGRVCSKFPFALMDSTATLSGTNDTMTNSLVLPCPYNLDGCSFSTNEDALLKEHLKFCQFSMQDYVSNFLKKKQEQLNNTSEDSEKPSPNSNQETPRIKEGENRSSRDKESFPEFIIHGSQSLLLSISQKVSKLNEDFGISEKAKEAFGKTKDTIDRTTNAIAESEAWKKSKDGIVTAKDAIQKQLSDMELLETVADIFTGLGQEIKKAIPSVSPMSSSSQNTQVNALHTPTIFSNPLNEANHQQQRNYYEELNEQEFIDSNLNSTENIDNSKLVEEQVLMFDSGEESSSSPTGNTYLINKNQQNISSKPVESKPLHTNEWEIKKEGRKENFYDRNSVHPDEPNHDNQNLVTINEGLLEDMESENIQSHSEESAFVVEEDQFV